MNTPEPVLAFTQDEIELIGNTADAMSAYMGKPVLAEIMDAEETGAEWVAFGIPLDIHEEVDEESTVVVQLGGPGARYAGSRGGMDVGNDVYSCECLWIIQLSDDDEGRYVKVDPLSQEYSSSNDLQELLPFNVSDEEFATTKEDDGSEEPSDDELMDDAEANETHKLDRLLDELNPPSKRLH